MWTTWAALLLVVTGVVPADPAPDLPDFSVRLAGGESERKGGVEMLINGQWQAVCVILFDLQDAEVACRQLGFIDSIPKVSWQPLRKSAARITFHCRGDESRLIECLHVSGRLSSSCSFSALVECKPAKDFSLRLRDKFTTSARKKGRLEVYLRGNWMPVCDRVPVDDSLARVACRELAFGSLYALATPGTLFFPWDNIRDRASLRFKCQGIERSLSECAREVTHVCDGPVGIMCSHSPLTEVRLVGNDGKVGRVEMKIGDTWGTVCREGFSDLDAEVVCRQGGFSSALASVWPNEGFGQASPNMTVWPYEFHCKGHEPFLVMCTRSRATSGRCTHDKDVAVSCQKTDPKKVRMRLVGGVPNKIGRLEVSVNGRWGTVCRNSFSTEAAKVSCRQMNLPYTEAQVLSRVIQPLSTGPIFLDAVKCSGNERHILSCDHNDIGETNCSHDLDVAIECKGLTEGNDRTCSSGGSRCKNEGKRTAAIKTGVVVGLICLVGLISCLGVIYCFALSRRRQKRANGRETSAQGTGSYVNGVFYINNRVRYTIQTPYSGPAMEWPERPTPPSPAAARADFGAEPLSDTKL